MLSVTTRIYVNLLSVIAEGCVYIYIYINVFDPMHRCRHGESGMMSVRAAGAGEGGAEGELLEEELTQVDRVLEEALKAVQRKSHLVFNLTSKEWLKHFDR